MALYLFKNDMPILFPSAFMLQNLVILTLILHLEISVHTTKAALIESMSLVFLQRM